MAAKISLRIVCNHSAQSWTRTVSTGQMYCGDCKTDINQESDGFWYRAEGKLPSSPPPKKTRFDRVG